MKWSWRSMMILAAILAWGTASTVSPVVASHVALEHRGVPVSEAPAHDHHDATSQHAEDHDAEHAESHDSATHEHSQVDESLQTSLRVATDAALGSVIAPLWRSPIVDAHLFGSCPDRPPRPNDSLSRSSVLRI